MLERVALGQTRFQTPGLAVDGRGIAMGRYGVLVFPALDGVVGWLRLYSDEAGLEDLLAEMKIVRVRTAVGARAFVILIPASSSYVMDRAARCARLWSGGAFTGTQRHFVKFRDDRSPYGYDVIDAGTAGAGGGDLVLHGDDASQIYTRDGELDVRTLVFRLSAQRAPGSERLDAEARAQLFMTVPPGLSRGVIRYLWRNRVAADIASIAVASEQKREFAAAGSPDGYLLARVRDLPARILDSFRGTPGITIYRPISEQVAVEIGYRHPLELSSCAPLFEPGKLYLFSGARDVVDIIAGPVEFADARHMTALDLQLDRPRERAAVAQKAEGVGMSLRLAPSMMPPRRIVGAHIEWADAPRLKKLIYMLPPAMLRGHHLAAGERGLVLVAVANVDVVPLGTLLCELAPGLLIPLGMDLVPRVAPEVLAEALGHSAGRLTVFPHGGEPFQLAESELRPLERRALARLEVPVSVARDLSARPPDGDPRVVNDPIGAFALWGYPGPKPSAP